MKIRFQADADLNEDIVSGVVRRHPEIDFQTATEAGLSGLKDEQVLEVAASEARILVSHDSKTMPDHFGQFLKLRSSPGVLIIPQRISISEAIDELVMIWSVSEAEEYIDSIRRNPSLVLSTRQTSNIFYRIINLRPLQLPAIINV